MTSFLVLATCANSLVAGGALLTLRTIRHARPATRLAYADAALLITALAPLLRYLHVGLAVPVSVSTPEGAGADPAPLLLSIYLIGAAMMLTGLARGVVHLIGVSRRADQVTDPAWQAVNREMSSSRPPNLRSSDEILMAMSWGVRPGTIMLDPPTLASPSVMRSVIAHEHAHLRRGDWLLLIVGRLVLALNWFNPLVWVLVSSRADLAEEVADTSALRHVSACDYAQALLDAARQRAGPLASPLTGGCLQRRVSHVLAPPTVRTAGHLPVCASGIALLLVATLAPAFDIGAAGSRPSPSLDSTQRVPHAARDAVPVPVPVLVPMAVPVPVPMDKG